MEQVFNVFEQAVNFANDLLWQEVLIGLLIIAGLYFSFTSKFVQFRWLRIMFSSLGEKRANMPDGSKGISSFQAFTISAAQRIGTANIAGVATAIVVGGPGAVFWMWIVALLGAGTAFFEATLAQVYKVRDKESGFRGGPAYYMAKGLNQKGIAYVFAVLMTITFGIVFVMLQSNTIANAYDEAFGVNPTISGVIVAIVVGLVIFGGAKSIANVATAIVPVMAGLYLILVAVILVMNYDMIIPMLQTIVVNAFGIEEVFGGAIGAAIINGFQRGLLSNEAGMGSAPNAAASAAVRHPVQQGLIQSLGVYFDTIIVCTATAIVILMYSDLSFGADAPQGIQVTQAAMDQQFFGFGGTIIAVFILLFAFSTILGNYFYAQSNLSFIVDNKTTTFVFRAVVVVMTAVGAVLGVQLVWTLADLFMALIAIINLMMVVALSPLVFELMRDYKEQKDRGESPIFFAKNISYKLPDDNEWGDEDYRKDDPEDYNK
ncbi:Amino-acid carrier protein AlsT [Jeotgalicoccus aerolatus]|uniref:AGCS family alanine or glycine:cation symporter n=1 Tax=Jeotgalicoccus aerolatus TaxID=709510 RepID=A0ABS4HLX9_9STAP|nr:alanine/glycine:cation symporter family protein [Jeotgalicoccus aerolatus]MBP1951922.1 AGCS family alanine or glycine:cation symporter [Jeotgalicoccus aerolatus]GGD93715.1 sodium:alanine symporter [Jeotgalicoccus aerolatus]CAD2074866.1 Amino-acid carrier protein AlsT [Jeotgalicoccus aerolatus]